MRINRCLMLGALAAVAVIACACTKNDPVGSPEMEEVGNVVMPDNVMLFVTTRSLDDFSKAITGIASAAGAPAGSEGKISELIQSKLIGTKNLDWMTPGRPLKLVVLDPAQFPQPFVMMVPLESRKAMLAAMDGVNDDVEGNEIEFKDATGTTRYVNIVGKNAVFTAHAGAFAAVSAFMGGDILKYPATQALDIQTTSKSLISVVKPLAAIGMSGAMRQFPQIGAVLGATVEHLVESLSELGQVRLIASFADGSLRLEGSAVPVAGSESARVAAAGATHKVTISKKLPGEGWFEMVQNTDPASAESAMKSILDSAVAVLGLTPEQTDQYKRLMSDVMSSVSGESMLWIGWEGEFPFRTMAMTGMTDSNKGKAASEQLTTLLLAQFGQKVLAGAQAAVAAAPAAPATAAGAPAQPADAAAQTTAAAQNQLLALNWTSPEALISSARDLLATNGVTADLKTESGEGMDIRHLELGIDQTRLAAGQPEVARYKSLLGDKLSVGFGFDEDAFYLAAGSDSVRDIRAARADGQGSPRMDKLIADAGFDVSWAMRLSLVDLGKILTAGYEQLVSAVVPGLATMTTKPEITVVSGSRNGRTVVGAVTIPVSGIAELRKPAAAGAAR